MEEYVIIVKNPLRLAAELGIFPKEIVEDIIIEGDKEREKSKIIPEL